MDRLQAMKVLLAVVEAGSLSAASRRLKIPLATVSRRIAELEAHLGAKLINRTSRSFDLTDAGRDYVAAARRILDDVAEAERAAAGEYAAPKGELIITAPLVFGQAACAAGRRRIPQGLSRGRRQAGAQRPHRQPRRGPCRPRACGSANCRTAAWSRCASDRSAGSSAPARPISRARGRPRHPAELAGHDCITFDNLMPADRWVFMRGQVRDRRADPLAGCRSTRPRRRSTPRLPASG